jgi:hypothetical protein
MTAALSVACAADDDDMNTSIAAESTSGSVTEGSTGAPGSSSGLGPQGSSGSSGDDDTAADASTGAPAGDSTDATTGDPSDGSETGTEPSPECVQYCDEFLPNCNELPDIEAYDDLGDCLQSCASFAHGPVGAFDGDTVECRIAHLTFEPMPGPGYYELHCFHAQEHPTAQCV